jgi:hypothetical protein
LNPGAKLYSEGFQTPEHDEIQLWISTNQSKFLDLCWSKFEKQALNESSIGNGKITSELKMECPVYGHNKFVHGRADGLIIISFEGMVGEENTKHEFRIVYDKATSQRHLLMYMELGLKEVINGSH